MGIQLQGSQSGWRGERAGAQGTSLVSRPGAGRWRNSLHTLIARSAHPWLARPHCLPSTTQSTVSKILEVLREVTSGTAATH